jgi:hypothetical protein
MGYFKRFLIICISGAVQVFFAAYLMLELLGFNLGWHLSNSNIMFVPGVLVFLGAAYLTFSYYFLDSQKVNNALYDEFTALRAYKLGSVGYGLNGMGIFILFSIQDWSNWSFQMANSMIYQIAAFAWLVFGVLLVCFSVGDYQESKIG